MVKSWIAEWHLVTELFTMVANQMVKTIQLPTICIPNKSKFAIQMFPIQIPTVQ